MLHPWEGHHQCQIVHSVTPTAAKLVGTFSRERLGATRKNYICALLASRGVRFSRYFHVAPSGSRKKVPTSFQPCYPPATPPEKLLARTEADHDGASSPNLGPPTRILLNCGQGHSLRAAGAQKQKYKRFHKSDQYWTNIGPILDHLLKKEVISPIFGNWTNIWTILDQYWTILDQCLDLFWKWTNIGPILAQYWDIKGYIDDCVLPCRGMLPGIALRHRSLHSASVNSKRIARARRHRHAEQKRLRGIQMRC